MMTCSTIQTEMQTIKNDEYSNATQGRKAWWLVWLCLVGLAVSVMALPARAEGLAMGGTRLIFNGAEESASISVSNTSDKDVWLMRFWVSPYGGEAAASTMAKTSAKKEQKAALPFVVTPPLWRLDPQSEVQLRVNQVADTLPQDRESVFHLNALAIPPKKGGKEYEKGVQSGLQFAINTQIKLIYRPKALNQRAVIKALPSKVTVKHQGNHVVVNNPTPYYITLVQIEVDKQAVQTDQDTMLAPFGSLSLPTSLSHGQFSYQTIDDDGARTPVMSAYF